MRHGGGECGLVFRRGRLDSTLLFGELAHKSDVALVCLGDRLVV